MALTHFVKRLIGHSGSAANTPKVKLKVIPRDQHEVSRNDMSHNALKVLYRLRKGGYQSFLVGGGVRDLLLKVPPKDFDLATDATPDQVHRLFRNCRLIGRRFRLAHILFGREIIEVATFRAGQDDDAVGAGDRHVEGGMIVRDNIYGNIGDDVLRRDFTINALYYNIDDFSIWDYVDGMADIKARRLRMIGDPETRFREDPVRMLRAVRFATKLSFNIDKATAAPIPKMAGLLAEIPAARLFEEVLKLFMSGHAEDNLDRLWTFGLLEQLFPQTVHSMESEQQSGAREMLMTAMRNTDQHIAAGKPVTPAFLFASLLWEPVRQAQERLMADGEDPFPAMQKAGDQVVLDQLDATSLPKRFGIPMREIWQMQLRLDRGRGRGAMKLMSHPRFRAAYDFLLLRAVQVPALQEQCEWWTSIQEMAPEEALQASRQGDAPRRRRGRRRPRRKNTEE